MERLAGRIILLWGWRRSLAAFIAGALFTLAQAPYDFFAVGFVSFPVLVWLLDGVTVPAPAGLLRRLTPAFSVGWWFGFGYFLAGLWWIGKALFVEADSFAWALPFAVVGIPFLLAFFYGFATLVARLLWSGGLGRIAALAVGFALAEWLRTFVLTGFPWNPVGLAVMPIPLLMQSVRVVGPAAIDALAVFVFAMPALLVSRRGQRAGLVLALILVAAHAAFGWWQLGRPEPKPEKTLAVRIVQPNVDLSEKWDEAVRDRIFASMIDLSKRPPEAGAAKPQLILWPETAMPFLFSDRPAGLVALGDMLDPGQMLVTGAVRDEAGAGSGEGPRYYNAVIAVDDGGAIVDAVDKVHLVPFGEYIPLGGLLERVGISQLVAGPMNFAAGSARHPLTLPGGVRGVPFICYEIIFPELVSVDAASAGVMLNVTNDAWFGNSPGPYQHFRQAQVRAVENGIPLLRAANTGISGVVDARGHVVDALALGVQGYLDVTVPIADRPVARAFDTRYVSLAVIGLLALAAAGAAARQRLRPN